MPKRPGTTQISAQIDEEFRTELFEYCRRNNISISNLIRKCLEREIQAGCDFHILSECEKLIDVKLQEFEKRNIVAITAKKV